MKTPKPHLEYILDDLAVIKQRLPADKSTFASDGILQDATLMRLVDVGEQLARLRTDYPKFYENESSDVWHKLIGLRNVVAHGYREIDLETVWGIVSLKLVDFEAQLQDILRDNKF